jgi:hypothetical protein
MKFWWAKVIGKRGEKYSFDFIKSQYIKSEQYSTRMAQVKRIMLQRAQKLSKKNILKLLRSFFSH